MSANINNGGGTSSRDILNLNDDLMNQSFYEGQVNTGDEQSEQNTEYFFKSKESTNIGSEYSKHPVT